MRTVLPVLAILVFSGVTAHAAAAETKKKPAETATFAGGCFWGMEEIFEEFPGVLSTRVGYTGGHKQNPTYEEVCTGATGHAESIEITYDSSRISYGDLLEFFFCHHDPSSLNRQGNDSGAQYRSAIFYHTPEQKAAALKAKNILERSRIFQRPMVTQIEPAGEFFSAEEYHQKYLKKNPGGYCDIHLQPTKVSEVLRAALGNKSKSKSD